MRVKILAVLVATLLLGGELSALRIRPGGGPGQVNLPVVVNDNSGNQWMIYQQGWLRQQGNMPLYAQAAMLTINGNGLSQPNNQARTDEKTGETIFDNLSAGGINVTRRILVNREAGYVRYIDILKNPAAQDMSVAVQLNSNFNYGVQSSQMVEEPKKNRQIGWAAMLHANRAVVEVYAGRGAKTLPQISAQPESNTVQMSMQLTVPANKEVAFVHVHSTAATIDAASDFAMSLRGSKFLSDVPRDLRKIIVNFTDVQAIGEREVLRGELFDVIELRGGDLIQGTITDESFKLQTFYGPVQLPAGRVVGLMNVGTFRPHQLLVTADGEVFGGTLDKQTIAMQLSSGQVTQVPLSQIARFGYRKRPGEPEEWPMDKPMIALRSGERMLIARPSEPIDVMTRYGPLKLPPTAVSTITFVSEEHGVHEIRLTDGSRFAGLVPAEKFDLQLIGTTASQAVSFPAATVARLQFARPAEESDDDQPSLKLSDQDELVGILSGQMMLDTAFDTITVNASEIAGLKRAADSATDVQVTLWDQTALSGQLREPLISCQLSSGVTMKIPVGLIEQYTNPQPQPSEMMIKRIKEVVAQLSADDWKQREQAESQLVAMGPIVRGVLKELSAAQPPEAQQRIDSVMKQLDKKSAAAPAVAPAPIIDQ